NDFPFLVAPPNMSTCRDCEPDDADCVRSNILPEVTDGGFLTSGYFEHAFVRVPRPRDASGREVLKPSNAVKCSHGGQFDKSGLRP
ncbi:hypothetical protein NL533_33260, partial [Klebsiella pneumoniae]|nr:hypothetical protein [Klebsiella pneumoniae]